MNTAQDGPKSKLYKCPEEGCEASYTKALRLEIHKRKHTGERPFKCDFDDCTKCFTNPAHLQRHKSLVHEKSCEVLCTVDTCGRVFNNKYSLKKHLSQHHSGDTLFKCAKCSEGFKKKCQLKRHLLQHSAEEGRPLNCSLCNISFGALHLYNKHKRNHKTYTCDCGVTCNRWTEFCEHRRTSCRVKEIDHKCVICNKVFKTKMNLKYHSLSHIEESKKDVYYCSYANCKRSYTYKKNLNSHIATFHEGKNSTLSINCTEEGCDTVFKSQKNLRQHLLNIHKLPKKKKDRRPRKDKGKRKKCMASVLSGIDLPVEEHLAIMNNSGVTKNISKDETKLTKEEDTKVKKGIEESSTLSRINEKNVYNEDKDNPYDGETAHKQDIGKKILSRQQDGGHCNSFNATEHLDVDNKLKAKFIGIVQNFPSIRDCSLVNDANLKKVVILENYL